MVERDDKTLVRSWKPSSSNGDGVRLQSVSSKQFEDVYREPVNWWCSVGSQKRIGMRRRARDRRKLLVLGRYIRTA